MLRAEQLDEHGDALSPSSAQIARWSRPCQPRPQNDARACPSAPAQRRRRERASARLEMVLTRRRHERPSRIRRNAPENGLLRQPVLRRARCDFGVAFGTAARCAQGASDERWGGCMAYEPETLAVLGAGAMGSG